MTRIDRVVRSNSVNHGVNTHSKRRLLSSSLSYPATVHSSPQGQAVVRWSLHARTRHARPPPTREARRCELSTYQCCTQCPKVTAASVPFRDPGQPAPAELV